MTGWRSSGARVRESEDQPTPAPANTAPRRLHPFALLSEVVETGRGWFVPAVIAGASMGGGHMGRVVVWGAVFLIIPTLLFALAEYLAFRYRVAGDELILDSGVLSQRHRVIPLSRVQNLELRQNVLQRAFGVAELRVETAGGDTEEPAPLILGRPEAERLRTELLARRDRGGATLEPEAAPSARVLARLSARDLALAGATANEAGIIAAALIGAIEIGYRLPLGLPRPGLDPRVWAPDLPLLGTVILGLGLLLVLLSLAWLLSVAGALLRYWDYTLERAAGELRKRYGGLERREITVPLARVQALRIEESLLRRPLGLASLKIETAGGRPGEGRRGAEAFLPLVPARDVPRLSTAVFDGLALEDLLFRPVHPYARRRAFVRYAAGILALSGGSVLWLGPAGLWLLALLLPAYVAAQTYYRHLGYALLPGFVVARSGFWTRVTWIVPERKLQTAHLVETPFQRRKRVATLVVDTAAGQVPIVDLDRDESLSLLGEIAERAARPEESPARRD